jgi:hypothetical protein
MKEVMKLLVIVHLIGLLPTTAGIALRTYMEFQMLFG